MGVYGADIAQLRSTATELERAAEQLASISTALGTELSRAPWHGADATSFRSHWDTDYSRRIADGSARLREAARALRSNADAQEATSAAGGGPSGGGLPGPGGSGTPGAPGSGIPTITQGPRAEPADGDQSGPWTGATSSSDDQSVSGAIGAGITFDDNWTVAGAEVTREGDYGVGAKGEVGWKFDFDGDESKSFDGHRYGDDIEKADEAKLSLGAEASGKVGAWAEDSIAISAGVIGASAGFEALAGARADVGAGVSLGTDGLQAAAKVGGFAGAEIKGNISGDVAGVSGGVEAGVRAGIGGELSGTADLGLDKVKVEFEIGASLGIGFSVKPSFEFSPQDMADDVMSVFGF